MSRDASALANRPSFLRRLLERIGEVLRGLMGPLLKDKFSLFLLVASIALTVVFFSLLGGTRPSSPGQEIALSTMLSRSEAKQLTTATLLDEDSRVVATSAEGRTLWAAYPGSDAQTTALIGTLRDNGAVVTV